jgi:hypothetical protein
MARGGRGRKGTKKARNIDPTKEGRGSGRTTVRTPETSRHYGANVRPAYGTSVEDGRAVQRSDVYRSIMKSAPARGKRTKTTRGPKKHFSPAIDLGNK